MSDDDERLKDKLSGGLGTAGKVTLLGGLGLAIGFKKLKDTIVGDPPSPVRKTLVYGSAALALGYTACSDDLHNAGSKAYEYLEGKQAQRIETLEERNDEQAERLNHAYQAKDSVAQAYQSALNDYEERVDSLSEEIIAQHTRGAQDTVIVQHDTDRNHEYQASQTRGQADNDPVTKEQTTSCWHPVQPGETLSEIAATYDAIEDYNALQKTNDISDPKSLAVGHPLQIPGDDCDAKTTPRPAYTVIEREHFLHEDLASLGDPERLTAYNEARGNDLDDTKPGQTVAVYQP